MVDEVKKYKCEKCGTYLSLDEVNAKSKLCKSCETRLLYGVSDNRRRFRRKR